MSITFASGRFTVTGGKIGGSVTSSTSSTLSATGLFTGFTTDDLAGRGVWIHSGTGSGQFRHISERDSDDQISLSEDWDVDPDATSQFLVAFDQLDFSAVNSTAMNVIFTGDSNPNPASGGIGIFAELSAFVTIGDNSTPTFVHFVKGALVTTQSPATGTVITANNNSVFQIGSEFNYADSGHAGCAISTTDVEGTFNRLWLSTASNSSCVVRFLGSQFSCLSRRSLGEDSARGYLAMQFNGNATVKARDCVFTDGVELRPFSSNYDVKNCKYLSAQLVMYRFNTDPSNIKFVGDFCIANSGNSGNGGSPQRLLGPTIVSPAHEPASASNGLDFKGDISAPKDTNAQNIIINADWNRRITHSAPPSQSFDNGASIEERYTLDVNVKDVNQVAVLGAYVSTRPIAGNLVEAPAQTNALTDANGDAGQVEITTRFTDADGGANQGWTSGQLPYWKEQSKDVYKLRVRFPSKRFLSTSADFSNPDNDGGTPLVINTSLLDDPNYTADGSLVTGVSVTDNRSAPVSWNGLDFGWAIVGDTSVNSSLTAQDIYNWWKYHASQNANLPGTSVSAGEAHNFMGSPSETSSGDYYDPATGSHSGLGVVVDGPTQSYGVRIVDQNGDAFPGFTRFQADDGSYYNAPSTDDLTVSSSEASTTIRVFSTGTQTVLSSTTGSQLIYTHSNETVDIEVYKAGFILQRQTGVVLSGDVTLQFNLSADFVYFAGHGLTYTTDLSYNRSTKRLTCSTTANGDAIYSALVDAFISQTSLYNTEFPLQANGSGAFYFLNDAEFFDTSSINNWKRAGFTYLDSAGVITREDCAVFTLSSGIPSGAQARYQQTAGSGTTNAINTDAIDQTIQVYGDATHGNFTLNTHLVVKYQENTYRQVRVDVVDLYGLTTLQAVAYPIATPFVSANIAAGDPSVTGLTLTNYGASPITRESLNWSIGIEDTNNNSGDDITRWLNWNISQGGTFQGEDTFNWPDMAITNDGSAFETEQGVIEGSAGAAGKGVWVERPTQVPHPDLYRQQSDSGAYYVLPVTANASVSDIVAGSRMRILNRTTATEIVNTINAGTSYAASYTDGTDYSSGDVIDVFLTYQSGTDARLGQQLTTVATSQGWSVIATQDDDDVYILNNIDGSTITKFTADFVDDEIDISSAVNFTATEAYAWFVYILTTEQGIREFFGGVTAENAANYRINTATVSLFWDNLTTTNIRQTDSPRFYRDDGAYPVKNGGVTTGGGGVDVQWLSEVYLATTGSGPLTPAQEAQLANAASDSATAVVQNALLVNDQGLNLSEPKIITEVTEGESYTETVDGVTKTVVKSGNTTTVTRTT